MSKFRSTIGYVGKDCVVLKDNSVFKKGEIVVVLSSDNISHFIEDIKEIVEDMDKSKLWIEEIKKLESNL